MNKHDETRRRLVKAAIYVPPAILTLKAVPAFASLGSGRGNHAPVEQGGGQPGGGQTATANSGAAYIPRKKKKPWWQFWN